MGWKETPGLPIVNEPSPHREEASSINNNTSETVSMARLASIILETQYLSISQPGAVSKNHPLVCVCNQLDEQFLCWSPQTVLASFQIQCINYTLPSLQAAHHTLEHQEGIPLNVQLCGRRLWDWYCVGVALMSHPQVSQYYDSAMTHFSVEE